VTEREVARGRTLGGAPARLGGYLALNAGTWALLAFQTYIVTLSLGSSRSLIMFSTLLGAGFLFVSALDYLWSRR